MKRIQLPMTIEDRLSLKAGDMVYLNGEIFTARDAAHKKLKDLIDNGKPLPFDMQDAVIYYVGPTPAREGRVIGSAGPTTSSRMDSYVPQLFDLGMIAMIGKGKRSEEVKQSLIAHKGIYFVAPGGAGALLSERIVKREMVAFEELLSEAITRLTVEDFPCFVGLDAQGNDIYDLD